MPRTVLLWFAAVLIWTVTAQGQARRYEAGVVAAGFDQGAFSGAAGGRFTINFSPSLALDTEFQRGFNDFSDFSEITVQRGGRASFGFAGIKAGLRRERIGIFGKVRPGFITFSRVGELQALETRRRTSFATDLGGILELYPSSRTTVRFDVSQLLTASNDRRLETGGVVSSIAPGEVIPLFMISAGVSYGFGRESDAAEAYGTLEERRWEFGAHFSTLTAERWLADLRTEPGIGGRASFNINPAVALEAEYNHFPRRHLASSPLEGGTISQIVAGVKAGLRKRGWGMFAKVRPGLVSYSEALKDANLASSQRGRLSHFAMDIGGVVEVYPSARTILRFDVGDTLIFFRDATIPTPAGPFTEPGETRNSVQISTGFSVRF